MNKVAKIATSITLGAALAAAVLVGWGALSTSMEKDDLARKAFKERCKIAHGVEVVAFEIYTDKSRVACMVQGFYLDGGE